MKTTSVMDKLKALEEAHPIHMRPEESFTTKDYMRLKCCSRAVAQVRLARRVELGQIVKHVHGPYTFYTIAEGKSDRSSTRAPESTRR